MADPKSPGASKASVEAILAEFSRREPTLTYFCARTKSLIEAILHEANLRYQSVQARVKGTTKLEKKYLDPISTLPAGSQSIGASSRRRARLQSSIAD